MTAAALVQQILRTQPSHVVTLERPVEYELHGIEGIVSRMEVGSDIPSYEKGTEALLHLGADVLMIGELENEAAIMSAVRAAAGGYRVYTTINSASASLALARITAVLREKDTSTSLLFSQLKKTIVTQSLVYKENILTPDIKIL
jgi:twitching motility protein PilT